jgi:predicted sugar kinase
LTETSASRKNKSPLALYVSRLAWSFSIVIPATEKTLSEGAEVAGITKICMATLASIENLLALTLHQANGLVKAPIL